MNIVINSENLGEEDNSLENKKSYWKAENHNTDNYLRAENWFPDVEEFTLTQNKSVVPLKYEAGTAILRYREELKLLAMINDQNKKKSKNKYFCFSEEESEKESLHDHRFLDKTHNEIMNRWKESKNQKEWLNSLNELENSLDEHIKKFPNGAFVKLSVRSPKDSVFDLSETIKMIEEDSRKSKLNVNSEYTLSENVEIIKNASWKVMCVKTGFEALRLLLRSERIYIDILQHELFTQNQNNFNLSVHVFEFCHNFDPNWEFRGFVSEGKRTCLTAYNPWVYDKVIVESKEKILEIITNLWDRVQPKVKSNNYCIDFAVSPNLKDCWIIEVNNFLPPLSGSGLFDFHKEEDKNIIFNGPFTFRIKETPTKEEDFIYIRIDQKTNKKTTTLMQPAPPFIMKTIENIRMKKTNRFWC